MPRSKTSHARTSHRFYRGIGAHGWGDSDYFTFSTRSPALRHWLAAQLPKRPKKILSVGCGTGELECHLAAQGHRVIGLDLSRAMLKRARRRGLERLVQADSRRLPFADGSFDAVVFAESLGHLDLDSAFREAARVLKRRGRLMATSYTEAVETHATYARVSVAEIADALAASGLSAAPTRFLDAKRGAVTERRTAAGSTVIYVLARKPGLRASSSAAALRG